LDAHFAGPGHLELDDVTGGPAPCPTPPSAACQSEVRWALPCCRPAKTPCS